jgi:hypothetical protein
MWVCGVCGVSEGYLGLAQQQGAGREQPDAQHLTTSSHAHTPKHGMSVEARACNMQQYTQPSCGSTHLSTSCSSAPCMRATVWVARASNSVCCPPRCDSGFSPARLYTRATSASSGGPYCSMLDSTTAHTHTQGYCGRFGVPQAGRQAGRLGWRGEGRDRQAGRAGRCQNKPCTGQNSHFSLIRCQFLQPSPGHSTIKHTAGPHTHAPGTKAR